ncbi:MAG: hypothetical protein LAO78_14185 [Acidobacteriia bacterium]|nr:hypothetical protein [Terriglobia bacterium]
MSSISRISAEEVSFAIRYLDPDLQNDVEEHEVCQVQPQFGHQVKLFFVVVSIAVLSYFATLRYLPAVIRLLN